MRSPVPAYHSMGRVSVWAYDRADQVSFLDAHVGAFEHFGGIPQRIVYDNLRTTTKRVLCPGRELAPRFAAMSAHYVFEPLHSASLSLALGHHGPCTLQKPVAPCRQVLGDPKKLPTRRGYGYLVSWKDRVRIQTRAQAEGVADQLLDDPEGLAALRHQLGHDVPAEALRAWLVAGLASDGMVLFFTEPEPRVFDQATVTNLVDLLPAEEVQQHESLTFEVFERGRKGLEVHYRLSAPGDDASGVLAPSERRSVNRLEKTSRVTVDLSEMQLSLPARAGATRPNDPDDPERDRERAEGGQSGDNRQDVEHGNTPENVDASTMVSLRLAGGRIDAVEAAMPLGEDPSQFNAESLTFARLVLSLPERQRRRS